LEICGLAQGWSAGIWVGGNDDVEPRILGKAYWLVAGPGEGTGSNGGDFGQLGKGALDDREPGLMKSPGDEACDGECGEELEGKKSEESGEGEGGDAMAGKRLPWPDAVVQTGGGGVREWNRRRHRKEGYGEPMGLQSGVRIGRRQIRRRGAWMGSWKGNGKGPGILRSAGP